MKRNKKMWNTHMLAALWIGLSIGLFIGWLLVKGFSPISLVDPSPVFASSPTSLIADGHEREPGRITQGGEDLSLRIDIENYIRNKFGKDGERALKIAKCESGLRVDAVGINTNKTYDRGIFQLNSIHSKITNKCAFDSKCNIDAAYNIYLKQGFRPWVCQGL